MSSKRLYRSETNRMVCGVCAGVAEYFEIDPSLVRLGFLLFAAWGSLGLLAYLIAAVVIPSQSQI